MRTLRQVPVGVRLCQRSQKSRPRCPPRAIPSDHVTSTSNCEPQHTPFCGLSQPMRPGGRIAKSKPCVAPCQTCLLHERLPNEDHVTGRWLCRALRLPQQPDASHISRIGTVTSALALAIKACPSPNCDVVHAIHATAWCSQRLGCESPTLQGKLSRLFPFDGQCSL